MEDEKKAGYVITGKIQKDGRSKTAVLHDELKIHGISVEEREAFDWIVEEDTPDIS